MSQQTMERHEAATLPAQQGLVRNPARRWWVLALVGIAQLMVTLSVTIANIALPQAGVALHMTASARQGVITAYGVAFGGLLLLGGRLGDLIGRRTTFLIGVIVFAGASASAGLAGSTAVLIAARAVQGAGGAFLAPAALSILTTTFTAPTERGRAFGTFSAISGAGGGIGLLLGGVLTDALSWRACFLLQLPIAALEVAGAFWLLRHVRGEDRERPDVLGAILVVAALASLVVGMTLISKGSGLVTAIVLIVAAVVLLGGFVWWESRSKTPLLPLAVVLDRDRGASFLAVFILAGASAGIFYFLTFFLQQVKGFSSFTTGLAFMPMVLTIMVVSVVVNTRVLPRFGPRVLVSAGMLLAAASLYLLAGLTPLSSYLARIVPALILMGLGYGAVLAPGMSRATLGVHPDQAGAASGLVNTSQQVGLAIGTALLSSVAVAVTAGRGTPSAAVQGYGAAFLTGAIIFTVGAVIEFALFRRETR